MRSILNNFKLKIGLKKDIYYKKDNPDNDYFWIDHDYEIKKQQLENIIIIFLFILFFVVMFLYYQWIVYSNTILSTHF